jgi:hypothetical protein
MKAILLLAFPFAAFAQIYTWKDDASTRFSNQPPAWYRVDAPAKGPRVLVIQGTRILDDTGLTMEERRRMRPPLHTDIPADRRRPLNGTKVP